MYSKRTFLVIVVMLAMVTTASFARLRHSWTFDELTTKADLVVIVKMESSKVSGEKWQSPFTSVYRGRTTSFKVLSTLKGNLATNRLEVLTFEYLEGDPVPSGPVEIQFRSDGDGATARPQYLMYLSKMNDGRYEPVSGRVDPDWSVKELSEVERKHT